jgi:hypothetical protein
MKENAWNSKRIRGASFKKRANSLYYKQLQKDAFLPDREKMVKLQFSAFFKRKKIVKMHKNT